jgi:hypothetical protein
MKSVYMHLSVKSSDDYYSKRKYTEIKYFAQW